MPPHPDPRADNFTTTQHHDTYPAISNSNNHGKKVLITGASKGIGRETAISYARAGAAVIILAARSSLDEVEKEVLAATSSTSQPQVLKLQLDVSSEASLADAVVAVENKVGSLDILINNAGYLENWKLIAESNPKDWWASWEVNIKGLYLTTRAFIPLILRGSDKTIINVSSKGAFIVRPGASAYQTAKFAVLRLTEFISEEYADQDIMAIALHPGGVLTELAKGMPEAYHVNLKDTPRLGADTIAWLTQERREWLSGRYLSVNWDMLELVAKKEEILEDDKLKMKIVL